ncbi:hypothetical protein K440DRAFT_636204 [Wilcoxina mikolae CBS 423.85]|nr:hypothetical protein K440DRAFT_636204 [Wilcoxina mikolae CBS 423.85]
MNHGRIRALIADIVQVSACIISVLHYNLHNFGFIDPCFVTLLSGNNIWSWSSGSNAETDPRDLRIAAAKDFSNRLTSKDKAGQPDLVTVVKFDTKGTVVYSLGDPANAAFDTIKPKGESYIAPGLGVAINELGAYKQVPTANRTGVVLMTDGEDPVVDTLVDQLDRAAFLGIRVSFGYLNPTDAPISPNQNLTIAILKTGGADAFVNDPEAYQSFVNLVVARGPTDFDDSDGANNEMFPGLSLIGVLSTASSVAFAQAPVPEPDVNGGYSTS